MPPSPSLVQILVSNNDIPLIDRARMAVLLLYEHYVVVPEEPLSSRGPGRLAVGLRLRWRRPLHWPFLFRSDANQSVGNHFAHLIIAVHGEMDAIVPVLPPILPRGSNKRKSSVEVQRVAYVPQVSSSFALCKVVGINDLQVGPRIGHDPAVHCVSLVGEPLPDSGRFDAGLGHREREHLAPRRERQVPRLLEVLKDLRAGPSAGYVTARYGKRRRGRGFCLRGATRTSSRRGRSSSRKAGSHPELAQLQLAKRKQGTGGWKGSHCSRRRFRKKPVKSPESPSTSHSILTSGKAAASFWVIRSL